VDERRRPGAGICYKLLVILVACALCERILGLHCAFERHEQVGVVEKVKDPTSLLEKWGFNLDSYQALGKWVNRSQRAPGKEYK
jgi:hypothetical protein